MGAQRDEGATAASLRVAGVQLDLAWEDVPENLRRAEAAVAEAAQRGARLVVLPEMFATGFSMNAQEVAAQGARIADWVAESAARWGVWLLGGYAVAGEAGARPRNRARLCDPSGAQWLVYDKIHPFSLAGEHEVYAAGEALHTVQVEGLRVTPVICYDLRFAELFRARAAQTDLFLVPASWPDTRRMHWQTLLRARAIENQAYVLGVNRVGAGDGLVYRGDSQLIDPWGEVQEIAPGEAGLLIGEVSAARVQTLREGFSFLADRKAQLYGRLAGD